MPAENLNHLQQNINNERFLRGVKNMKKTMVFENETAYDNWFDVNEEKEDGHDFLENRVVIIKETRTINGKKFNGFSADSTIECKNVRTAVRRFVKELNSNGFEVSVDNFECSFNGENLHDLTGSGMVVEVEEIDDGRYYVNYMCYQDEVEEEKMETATDPETAETEETRIDDIKKFKEKSELNKKNDVSADEKFHQLTKTLIKSLFKAIGTNETRKIPFTIANDIVFFNYNGTQYKYYPSQCKIFKKYGRKYHRINWKDFSEENIPEGQKQKRGRSPPYS